MAFDSRRHADLPVEVLEYRALIDRMGDTHFRSAQRVSFGLVFLAHRGRGRHTVDFDPIRLLPGRMVLVWPGQVQQWHVSRTVEASVVLAQGSLPPMKRRASGLAPYADLGSDSRKTATDLVAALAREQNRFEPTASSVELITALFEPLIGLFRRAALQSEPVAAPPAYLAFRDAIEAEVGRSRNVRDYVARLGYSERTVNRACRLATGLTAKGVLDERLRLEAKRLLAHSDSGIASVAAALGFSEATNFNKFFARGTGVLPSEFRRQVRSAGYGPDTMT